MSDEGKTGADSGVPSQLLYGVMLAAAVRKRQEEIVMEAGFVKEDEHGNEEPDWDEMKKAAAAVVVSAKVKHADERATNGVSKGDLFRAVLPDAPGADGTTPDDYIDAEASDKLEKRIWSITLTSPTAYLQRQLVDGLVLVRARVHRGNDPVTVAYVTDDDDLLLLDSFRPELDGFVKRATKLHDHGQMLVDRHPSLAPVLVKQLESGLKTASQNARVTEPAQITAGE